MYSIAATWSPFTPRFLPSWLDSDGRFCWERMRIGGLPIAPADITSTLHSICSDWPFGIRVGFGPSLSITSALTR